MSYNAGKKMSGGERGGGGRWPGLSCIAKVVERVPKTKPKWFSPTKQQRQRQGLIALYCEPNCSVCVCKEGSGRVVEESANCSMYDAPCELHK